LEGPGPGTNSSPADRPGKPGKTSPRENPKPSRQGWDHPGPVCSSRGSFQVRAPTGNSRAQGPKGPNVKFHLACHSRGWTRAPEMAVSRSSKPGSGPGGRKLTGARPGRPPPFHIAGMLIQPDQRLARSGSPGGTPRPVFCGWARFPPPPSQHPRRSRPAGPPQNPLPPGPGSKGPLLGLVSR